MPFTQIAESRIKIATAFSTTANDHSVVVLPGVLVASSGGVGIVASFSSQFITVLGTVSGFSAGLAIGNQAAGDLGSRLTIGGSATIFGDRTGIVWTAGDGILNNRGDIYSNGDGISVNSVGGTVTIRNFDLIAADVGIDVAPTTTSVVEFFLRGVLDAETIAYRGGDNIDRFYFQTGTLRGDVFLGGGNDIFQYNGFNPFPLIVDLGSGNDIFRVESTIQGLSVFAGIGSDTLELSDNAFLGSVVLGTGQFEGFERVIGGRREDSVTGDSAANSIFGRDGADILNGGGGSDLIDGGQGADDLTGGSGNDSFRFLELDTDLPSFLFDQILDWSATPTNDDRILISAAGFGGGLVAGGPLSAAQFESNSGGSAMASTTRFIFDSDDHILWFDPDGNGAAERVLVTDFVGTPVITQNDIFIIA